MVRFTVVIAMLLSGGYDTYCQGIFLNNIEHTREVAVKNACMRYAPVGIDSVQASAFSQSSAIWSDGMTNELTFNATKLIANRLDLLSSQELLPSDIGVRDRDLAEKRVAHKLELREGRAKAAAKKTR